MELKPLAWFLCIAETGSLSKAALQLQVSQSMLSRGIQDLESELGHRLFHRTGRGMHPTEFGRRLVPLAQRATQEVTRFTDEAKALRGKLSGTVAIGLPGSIAARLVAPLVRLARDRYPELSLRFVEGLSGGIEEWLASRRIDIGLVFAREPRASRKGMVLASSNLYLVGPAGDALTAKRAVTVAQLASVPIMLPGRPHSVRTMVEDACAEAGIELDLLCEIDSLLAIRETVAAGCGYT
ncbi:MAG: LysR family transcriptional regulator, partial [Vicinamibacteria bacterium]